jgi:hypothetical protein
VPSISQHEFFTTESLEFFSQWQGTKYDSDTPAHKAAGAQIQSTVWETTLQLGKASAQNLPGFKVEGAKRFLQLGKPQSIKHYTWVKIFKDMDNIFFTIGIDAKERAFIYKIDCLDKEKSRLTTGQITMFRDLISESAKWNEISYETLIERHDFHSLTKLCVDFIKAHEAEYDALIRIIAGDPVPTGIFKNTMLERSRPTGRDQLPTSDRNFKGTDTDFLEKSRQQKELGTCGEELVMQYEKRMLTAKGLLKEAGQVRAAKDGEGYDVLSYDAHGIEKYIEVKTTTGGNETAFYLSENERAFMSKNPEQYSIYRLYHFDADSNFAEFFEVRGDVESQLLMQPTQYRVFVRSNALEVTSDTKDNLCIATS